MDRDLYQELDELKAQVAALSSLFGTEANAQQMAWVASALKKMGIEPIDSGFKTDAPPRAEDDQIECMSGMFPNPHIAALIEEDTRLANKHGMPGVLTYFGAFSMSHRQSNWVRHVVNVEGLFRLIEDGRAAQVLACVGNNDRLSLLLALLKTPMSAAQLVEQGRVSSSGQAYHHLKVLQAADLIEELESAKGVYAVKSHRVQGLLMLLAGVSDLLDPSQTQGCWAGEEE
ncbi:MAG: helix-turn-helix domain-containing protein [Oscillospiraceae bacterium]|jgi:DNA-binding transcriptional ArsR family regulator|nr:helix-turn-helix domain-containing protein [Oscillospiraceae bacterium]